MFEKCEMNIQPRQSGKSEKIIQYCKRNPTGSIIIITLNRQMGNITKERLREVGNKNNNIEIIPVNNLDKIKYFRGRSKIEQCFIDEYLFYTKNEQKGVYYFLKNIPLKILDIKIFTTSYRMVNECLFYIVKMEKSGELSPDIREFIKKEYMDEYNYLYHNFLTDPKTKIFNSYEYAKKMFSKEIFETEYLGKLFKGE